MANRSQHHVGGGLGTFRAQARNRFLVRQEFEASQRAMRHQRAVAMMHAAATRGDV